MGCWNKTCGLTNLPIYSGDRVMWFLLVQAPTLTARDSYVSSQWEVIPVPVYGTYDDYGFIEPDAGQEWKLELFDNHFANVLVKRNDDLGEATTPFSSFESLNESLRNDSFGIKEVSFQNGRHDVTCIFGDFMIHADTFAELTAKNQRPWTDETYTRDEIEATLVKFQAWQAVGIAECEALIDADSQNNDARLKLHCIRQGVLRGEALNEFVATLDTKPEYAHHYCGAGVVQYWYGNFGSEHGYITKSFMQNMNDFGTQPCPLSIKEQVDVGLLHHVMSGLRKQFGPSGHEGSQDNMWSLHDQFALTYQNRIAEYKAECEE